MPDHPIKVKLLSRVAEGEWLRYFPDTNRRWGNCEFSFDKNDRNYDWLVVYDDLPARDNERFTSNKEVLACHDSNTLLITTEPSTIKTYGRRYASQFGHVLTSQQDWALPHPHRIFSQPALRWFYGVGNHRVRPYNETISSGTEKTKLLATVCSDKQQAVTLHKQRYHFTQHIKQELPELDIYGRGIRPMDDKAEAIDSYLYHIAIENFSGIHHWTEKLADCFLGLTLPFYFGCPNITDYFPEQSFISININDPEQAIYIIRQAIQNDEYQKRLPALKEAKQLLLTRYNIFAVIANIVEEKHLSGTPSGRTLVSRRGILKQSPLATAKHLWEKTYVKIRHRYY